ncbi:MAG TPA: acyltransferase family protein [Allosphingosinicella sp.]|jgi:peptidoglycan/LPS O-acetylase OafA/YrhL|nr:acyltransferase family protein [Allosphingosinicella sp.]
MAAAAPPAILNLAGVEKPRRKMVHIEILRGISVLLVLLYHLGTPGLKYGYLGVDIFFVISGFLMAMLYGDIRDLQSAMHFFRRRLARLLPAYYVVLIAIVFAAALIAVPHEFADCARYSYWSAILMPNIGFWIDESYFESHYFRPMLNFWSLGVELQFYLVFPLLVVAQRRWRISGVLVALGSVALFLAMSAISPKTAFFQTPCRIWEFMAGFYIARGGSPRLPRWSGEGALALLLVLILLEPILPLHPAILAVLVTAAASLFIGAGLDQRTEGNPVAATLEQVGKYSYSIYLIHFPVIALLGYKPFEGTTLQLAWPFGYVEALALTALLSVLLFHFVETPFRSRRSPLWVGGMLTAGAAAAASAALVSSALNWSLIPPNQVLAASAWFDRLPYRCPKLVRIEHPFDKSCLVAGRGGPVVLLVGDSHSDLLKAQLGDAVARAGGSLRLMVTNEAVGDALTPEAVIAEAQLRGNRAIVLHAHSGNVHPEAIARTVELARARNIFVAIILPVPEPGYNVPRVIFSHLQSGEPLPPAIQTSDYLREQRQLIAVMEDLARRFPNVRLFYPHRYLCTPRCMVEDAAGKPFYSDTNHLTQTGVRVLIPMLAQVAIATTRRVETPGAGAGGALSSGEDRRRGIAFSGTP